MFQERKEMLIFGVVFVLAGTLLTDATQLSDHTKSKRQVTYTEKANDSKEDATHSDHDFQNPVTKRPLPSQLAYPGDLSRFFTSEWNSETSKADPKRITSNTTAVNSSAEERTLKRKKRGGGYILENREKGDSVLEYGFKNEPLLYSASTLAEFAQRKNSNKGTQSEMSFDGAGFLRVDEEPGLLEVDSFQTRGSGRNSYGSVSGNWKDVNDFKKVFNPSTHRKSMRYVEDIEHTPGDRALIKMTLEKKVIPKSSEMVKILHSLRNGNVLGHHPTDRVPKRRTVVKLIRHSTSGGGGNQPFLQNSPHHSAAKLSQQPQQIEESFLNYHTISPFQIRPRIPLSRLMFSNPNRLLGTKVFRRKRSTSTHMISSPAPIKSSKEDSSFEGTSQESRKNYRMEKQKDQHGADSGFIPITGSYDGGVIHLSLPYYGSTSPQPPSYGPPSTVHVIHTYPPPPSGPQSRHYGASGPADQHFFHPSEARRFSYGVLGSGNFEVIRGGIFPDDEPTLGRHPVGGRGYPGDRVPFEGGSYRTYGGTTEIIFDGPIQGFQGFDNFPAHLINALSKHGDVTVHVPPERRRDESQLIPVTYPLQAVS